MLSDDYTELATVANAMAAVEQDGWKRGHLQAMSQVFSRLADGPILQTPDGLHTYRVGVDNAGNLTTTLVT